MQLKVEYLDKPMRIQWTLKNEHSIEIYQKTAQDIENGFYQKHRFYVLPYLPEKFRDRVVFFPNVENYIRKFRFYNHTDAWTHLDKEMQDEITNTYEKYRSNYKTTLSNLKTESVKYEEPFEEFCRNKNLYKTNAVFIAPVFIGSVGRYYMQDNCIWIYPRYDRKINEIYGLILTALVHMDFLPNKNHIVFDEAYEKNWWRKQKITEKLFNSQEFNSVFGLVKDAHDILEDNTVGELAIESMNYVKKLGFPIEGYIQQPEQIPNCTKTEMSLLNLLIQNKGRIVTYDQIAQIMWRKDVENKFSLYAISKVIERLKIKIKKTGIMPNLIHSQRGMGYVLFD